MNEALDVCVMCDHENGRTRYRGEVSRRDNDEVLFTGAWQDTPEAAKREAHEWIRAKSAGPFMTEKIAHTGAPRGTDAQILKERELTVLAISGAMAFGELDTNPPPEPDHWLAPFWRIGRKQAEMEAEINRRKGDPRTRLHNLCEAIAEEADGSEFSREEWDRIDAENSKLRAEVSALRASHAELRGCLASMMDWARELPDQYLDSDPEVRASFVEDLRAARAALAHAPE